MALRALNRFGLGARIGERHEIPDAWRWLRGQLDVRATMDETGLPSPKEIAEATGRVQVAQRSRDQARIRETRRELQGILTTESSAALRQRITTDAPFIERLVSFWSNHLCISVAAKRTVVPLAGLYEREVIRPHVLGRFADMVLASAHHPAMLLYLDNVQSVGPGSPGARQAARRGRERGLNENYARELLELHTLGVGGGYSQKDVEELARILTGWTVTGLGSEGEAVRRGFLYRGGLHEPGGKSVLGKRYSGGEQEGVHVIEDLCAHPATARFIATKLVRHFVADDPPEASVNRIERAFRDTGGDLRTVSAALIDLDEAWDPSFRKIRTPQDWLVGTLRAFGAVEVRPVFIRFLRQLRHPLWAPGSPKGYGDRVRDWADPDGLLNRAELARTATRRIVRSGVPPERLLDVMDVREDDPLTAMLRDEAIPPEERMALALGGPAFQWR